MSSCAEGEQALFIVAEMLRDDAEPLRMIRYAQRTVRECGLEHGLGGHSAQDRAALVHVASMALPRIWEPSSRVSDEHAPYCTK